MRREALAAAFRATCYRVETPARVFDVRIGVVNPVFDDFLRSLGATCWGLLTAHNPGGIRCDDENPKRQRHLLRRLQELGWSFFFAGNIADDGTWPEEASVLVLHICENEVSRLAAEFAQQAIVCGEVGTKPRLVWIREVR